MRPLRGYVGDQLGNLLIGQVPASRTPAIEEHERLVEVVGFELPELLGRLLLRSVTAVIENRDVALFRLSEVVAEGIDDGLARGLAVLERLEFERDAFVSCHALGQVRRECLNVIDTAAKLGNRAGIVVNGDQQGVDGARHSCALLVELDGRR